MLRVLQRIVEAVNQAPDFELALQTMVRQVKEALQTDSCTVYLADHEQQQFALAATDGLELASDQPIHVPFGEGVISLAAQREEPLNFANAFDHPKFLQLDEVDEKPYKAMLAAPVIHRRRVLGVLAVQQREARAFTGDEEAFVVTLAAQLAVVIAHAEAKGFLRTAKQSPWLQTIKGLAAAPGVAIGQAYVVKPRAKLSEVTPRKSDKPEHEIRRFRSAVARTRQELLELSESMRGQIADETLAIFDVYHAMLDSANLGQEVEKTINDGWRAQTALKLVVENLVNQFENLDDDYIRERASDVRDLGQRILSHLKEKTLRQLEPPPQCILVAHEVTATMLAELPHTDILGMVSIRGSGNSHAAIMARSMGIPAVLGADDIELNELNGETMIVDGYNGDVFVDPPLQVENEYRQLADEELELREKVEQARGKPVATEDGVKVTLQLNVGLNTERDWLKELDIQSVGLYRTEIPFMMRERLPTEDEQVELYGQILQQFKAGTVVMRTLDVGGDKPLPYLPLSEENPFLGWRGIRMTLDHPEIFLVQIRAMLRAAVGRNNLNILLPMITSAEEVDEAARMVKQAYHEVAEESYDANASQLVMPKLGVMIEVPAMVYHMHTMVDKVDFFSVGSNDLTQYMLAVDRNNQRVAGLYDAFHPAVLHALKQIIERANELNKPVSVCGELAGEPGGALLLIAMGYRTLSMNSYNIDRIRWIIRHSKAADLDVMLERALAARSPQEVRKIVTMTLEEAGLGGFVRAGG
ncbi:Phosphoenolpyruvate-dependent phosphotransferase system [Pseudidiomarina piscicola]|uniref:phosphoenolpyruvate--protein phosphotransferase n=1 Tax=Pseudidiomarina piscicola TaxID=2614830 RepID=A0A6S6WMQ4_9GAMM|nr:phosphoenolpyruvate--protein phosphotransferase [Pseudidiomarina piscicola]CAB0151104.1 Phosphoenolpyruvate-dependent phosphotransferase system [Pseudidiomarina piscicola]VZT40612.1 Phosphoenolpyruvate-dependent phosphotransferase system [Pseudomonas aeruginosa]